MTELRQHGTRTKYVHEHCRCEPCSAANRKYSAARERKTSPYRLRCVTAARWWLVQKRSTNETILKTRDRDEATRVCAEVNRELDTNDPLWAGSALVGEVRKHVRLLQAQGVSMRRTAQSCGISRTRLLEVTHQRTYHHARPRRRRLLYRTAQRILAVQTTTSPAGGAIVDGAETARLVDEILAGGVRRTHLARALGSTAKQPTLQIRRHRVVGRTAARVRAIHETLRKHGRLRPDGGEREQAPR